LLVRRALRIIVTLAIAPCMPRHQYVLLLTGSEIRGGAGVCVYASPDAW